MWCDGKGVGCVLATRKGRGEGYVRSLGGRFRFWGRGEKEAQCRCIAVMYVNFTVNRLDRIMKVGVCCFLECSCQIWLTKIRVQLFILVNNGRERKRRRGEKVKKTSKS